MTKSIFGVGTSATNGALACLCLVATLAAGAARAKAPPGALPEHKVLAADEGTWDATIRTYMGGPDADPAVSKGTEVNEVMPGGMWVLSKFDGDFGGMAFQGRGQFGYDPVKKKYVGTWIDSMSPMLSVLEGEYDAKTKTMTYRRRRVRPRARRRSTRRRWSRQTKDDGSRVFTLYMKFEGQPAEVKFMEITYAKRK